jgi:hypothetical protein
MFFREEGRLKPIQTRYAGCYFRSRLEARWAVFFDALGIKWEYEPEGYNTSVGSYLPDFYLPEIRALVEIKPYHLPRSLTDYGHEPIEATKVREAAAQHWAKPVPVLGCGNIGEEEVYIYVNDQTDGSAGESWWLSRWNDVHYCSRGNHMAQVAFMPFFDREARADGTTRRDFCNPFTYGSLIPTAPDGWDIMVKDWSEDEVKQRSPYTQKGYQRARSARFEHGQTP